MEGIPTGIDFLDAGADGFYRGKPYLVFGGSGTGKSIFGLQVAHAGLVRGESALYVCREKADDLIQQGERLGFPLSEFVDNDQLILLEYDDGFRDIVTRSGPEAVLVELQSEVADLGVRRVILDPVDPFFSSMDDEGILRSELRLLTSRFEELGWTPLLLCDGTVKQSSFILRVFSEVCWGLFELQRGSEDEDSADHELLVYKMRNVQLQRSKFGFRIGDGGIGSGAQAPATVGKRGFARFRRASSSSESAENEPATPPAVPPAPAQPAPAAQPPSGTTASAPVAQPEGVVPTRATGGAQHAESAAGEDDLELLDERALADLEAQLRARRSAPPEVGSASGFEAPPEVGSASGFEAPAGFAIDRVRPAEAASAGRPEPTRRPAEAPRSTAPDPVNVPGSTAPRPRILVIEGDEAARAGLTEACAGAELLWADEGVAGLRVAAEERPDLIVMGARMPRLNGIGLCRILREHAVTTPVILLCSAHAGPGEVPRALAAGAHSALTRPLAPEALSREVGRLLADQPPGSSVWTDLDPADALRSLVPREVGAESMEEEVAIARGWAEEAGVPVSLIGYEFRFVEGEGSRFVHSFFATLRQRVRAEDAVCRWTDRRLAVLLVDADDAGARAVIGRVHQEMAERAADFLAGQAVKPKALYRLLTLQPQRLAEDDFEPPFLDRLFEQPPRLIEQDLDDRPGEPVEKYPLLEAAYHALAGELSLVTSPLDGSVHEIVAQDGRRSVSIDGHCYRLQSPEEESPAGFRVRSGATIVWVEQPAGPAQPVARVEDGRVFRGKEA